MQITFSSAQRTSELKDYFCLYSLFLNKLLLWLKVLFYVMKGNENLKQVGDPERFGFC